MALVTTVVTIEGENKGLFLKPITEYKSLTDLGFTFIYGQRDGFMYFMTEKDKITKKTTDCGYPSPTSGSVMTRKALSPVFLDAYDTQCARTFDNTILSEMRKVGINSNDLSGTQLQQILLDIYRPVVARDMLRIALLADTSLVGDTNYSMIDGWLAKLNAQIPGAQDYGALSDTAINLTNIRTTMKDIYNKQTLKLRQVQNDQKAFYVTRTVFEAWQDYVISINPLESSKNQLLSGEIPTTYRGIQLIVLDILDSYLPDVDGTSGVANHPNKVIYAKKDQTAIMLDSPAAGTEYKSWYDINTDLNKFDARYRMDIQIGYTDFFVIAGI